MGFGEGRGHGGGVPVEALREEGFEEEVVVFEEQLRRLAGAEGTGGRGELAMVGRGWMGEEGSGGGSLGRSEVLELESSGEHTPRWGRQGQWEVPWQQALCGMEHHPDCILRDGDLRTRSWGISKSLRKEYWELGGWRALGRLFGLAGSSGDDELAGTTLHDHRSGERLETFQSYVTDMIKTTRKKERRGIVTPHDPQQSQNDTEEGNP